MLQTDIKQVPELLEKVDRLKSEVHKQIVGQEKVLDQLLIGFLAGGHALLEGVPGLAKTLMIRSIAEALNLKFKRIQFTPDLMPTDLIGTDILALNPESGERYFKFNRGPLFANIILADEINRTPPKTQSALLEAMQEYAITYGGKTYPIDLPFFILATQNPIEHAGTFPLPEAQLDRFLLYIRIDYPTAGEELDVLSQTTGNKITRIEPVLDTDEVLALQKTVRDIHIHEDLVAYVRDLVRASRPSDQALEFVRENIEYGAGPRAGQSMILAAKAHALIHNRYAVTPKDLQIVAFPVLRHRIILNFKAMSEQKNPDDITRSLLESVTIPIT